MNPRERHSTPGASGIANRQGSVLTIQYYHGRIVDEWDGFVRDSLQGHYEQTSLWGMVKQVYGWQPSVILVREKGDLVGGVMVLVHKHRLAGSIGYVTRGPLTKGDDPLYLSPVVDALCTFAKAAAINYLVVVPPFYVNQQWVHPFRERGFFVKPRELPPTGLITASVVIDLSQSLESILGEMKKTTRYEVRKSARSAFTIRIGDHDDIPIFWDLLVALCERRGTSPLPERKDFFENVWRHFADREAVRLFICEYDETPVSALFGLAFGSTFRAWKVGWNGQLKNKHPNHFIWWEAIKWAKAKGFQEFDFGQIIPEHAEAVIEGREVLGGYAGVTSFKLGFGGRLIFSPEPLYSSFNPILRIPLKMAGHRLLSCRPITTTLRAFANRSITL